jgi:GT2 family glycosyltransferase
MSKNGVSVVVVSFNTQDKLRRCLNRCLEQLLDPADVIVVDNGSSDGSPEMVAREFPRVTLIANRENLGFGAANNLGAEVAKNELVLFLNSDAYAEREAICLLADVFDDPTIVAAGGRLLNMDGSLQVSSANSLTLWAVFCEQFYFEKLFPKFRLFSPYWNSAQLVELPEPAETTQVMGAALMVRNGLEPFDERYFLYCEDTDLCRRLRHHGRIVYVKSAIFQHELGSSSSKDPILAVARYNRGKELYFSIHHGPLARALCVGLDWCGALLRFAYWTLRVWRGGGEAARLTQLGFKRLVLQRGG